MKFSWNTAAILILGPLFSLSSHGFAETRYANIKQVVVSGHFQQILIGVHNQPDVVIQSKIDPTILSFQQTGEVLSIKATNSSGNLKSAQIVNGPITHIVVGENASSVVSIGGAETVVASGGQPPAQVELVVPKGTSIKLQGTIANAQIGDTFGDFSLDTGGSGKIATGAVGDASIRIAGATSAHIANLFGNLLVAIAGSGKLAVASGKIETLRVGTTGASSVDINAVADQAQIDVTGAGSVKVKQVKTTPRVSITGAGSVNVGGS